MRVLEINWNPTVRQLRHFGLAALVAFSALGGLVAWRHQLVGFPLSPAVTMSLRNGFWALASLCGLLSILKPAWLRPLYLGLVTATWPLGLILSRVILVLLYFGVFTPLGLLFQLVGRDILRLRFEGEAPSYWTPRSSSTDPTRYFKQF